MTDRGDRRNIDDRAAALPRHHRNDVLHRKERAFEIDREHAVPIRLRYIDHAPHLGDADIVVEHVDAAIGIEACGDHRLDVAAPGRVGGKCGRLAALGRDDLDGLFRGRGVTIDAKNLRALACESHGGRLAVAPSRPDRAGADHQRCLAFKPLHRRLLLSKRLKPIGHADNGSSRGGSLELPHRLAASEQPFRGVVGRHFDQ